MYDVSNYLWLRRHVFAAIVGSSPLCVVTDERLWRFVACGAAVASKRCHRRRRRRRRNSVFVVVKSTTTAIEMDW